MDRPPLSQAEIKELQQLSYDLKALQAIITERVKRVDAIVMKYSAPKTAAAIKREEKRQRDILIMEGMIHRFHEDFEIKRMRGRIKYLRGHPEPDSEREIKELTEELISKGRTPPK